jgi:methylmalonyl-CoA epimerase
MVRLEHIGIAVRDAGAVAALFEVLFEGVPYKQETVAREGVRTHFLATTSAKLELLEALGPDSPIAGFLEKRGEGLHHLAFEVADVDAVFARLHQLGFPLLGEAPRPGADGKRIFFVHPKRTHGVLVEFCQSTPTPLPLQNVPAADGPCAVCTCGVVSNPAVLVLGHRVDLLEPLLRRMEPFFYVLAPDSPSPIVQDLQAVLDHFGVAHVNLLVLPPGADAAEALVQTCPERLTRWIGWRLATHPNLPPDCPALHVTDVPEHLEVLRKGTPVLLPPIDGALPDLDVFVPLVRGWLYADGFRIDV